APRHGCRRLGYGGASRCRGADLRPARRNAERQCPAQPHSSQITPSEVITMKKIRTVTGDVPADKMGRTLTHEHLLYTYPGGEYDHNSSFDLDQAVDRIATELKAGMDRFHYGTIVDMTPAEVGRNPELMKRVAQ